MIEESKQNKGQTTAMLSLIIAALSLTPVQLQLPEVAPVQSYCTSSISSEGKSSGASCGGRSYESITPQSSPECGDVCPRGNSGQPEEPIGAN